MAGKIDTNVKVDLFPILGASPNGFLFKDEKIRDLFVERIKLLKSSGEFQKIFDKYTVEIVTQPKPWIIWIGLCVDENHSNITSTKNILSVLKILSIE